MPLLRHIEAIPPARATGLLAEVYRQIDAEFSSAGPAVRMTSPAPELMAAGWALMREAQLVGEAPAVTKAIVALGVSLCNGVDYDVEGYLAILRALGAVETAEAIAAGGLPSDPEFAELLFWARSTGGFSPEPVPAEHAVEYQGTALFTHYVNRMVAAFLPAGLRPGGMRAEDPPAFEGAPVLRELTRSREPGTSLALISGNPTRQAPDWAGDTPIGAAFAGLSATAAQGSAFLSAEGRDRVSEVIAVHRGLITPGFDLGAVLDDLDDGDRAAARVAILAALAPHRLQDAEVAAWRATNPALSDHCTVFLVAYGAMAAVDHIAERVGAGEAVS
ncbi:hypothetical protein AB0I28_22340 [Phytomonospora sp. NPDC050363]|uniref:hypothetical protein n=1 Tax=Phytomonospora sp. NPDC050363 TaxID=3155642 RepID=UPI00340065D1